MARTPRDRTAERAAITAAADRLLAGTPLRSATGRLTQTELIGESGLRRDVVYSHRDLTDQFKARVKAQSQVPTATQAVTDQRDQLAAQLAQAKTELASERAQSATLRRLAAELSIQLHDLREELPGRATVTRLPLRRDPATIGPCS